LQCLPNFELYWDQPWGGMVTIRIKSTFKQFTFISSILQELTDLLFRSSNLAKKNTHNHYSTLSEPQPIIQVPFEIIVI
jgi:hypothetical protein